MKKIKPFLYSTLLLISVVACNSENPDRIPSELINITATADSANQKQNQLPEITFTETQHDFGKIAEGIQATYNFKFSNTGKADLLIVGANASCGCTVPEYPKQIIKPGQDGYITVKYDSKGRPGIFEKTITVNCNTIPRETILTIRGEVEAQDKN